MLIYSISFKVLRRDSKYPNIQITLRMRIKLCLKKSQLKFL